VLLDSQRKIDWIDAKILEALLKDARTSFTEIAKKCNVQANVIRTHYNRLKQDGVITGEILEVQPEFFGYNCRATLRLRVDTNKMESVVNQLKNTPKILRVAEGVGRKNLLCFTITRNIIELNKVVERVKGFSGVTAAEADLWVNTTRSAFPENLQIRNEEH
jgi:DNA-binding Lrp family transcriptional regulator